MNFLYILLPVHNRKNVTLDFISSLKKQSYQNFHLILIDDGSTDGTSEAVSKSLDNFTLLKSDGNLWWAGGLQKGIDYLKDIGIDRDDIVLFINDDTEMPRDFLKHGSEIIMRRRHSIAKATLYCRETKRIVRGFVYNPKKLEFKETNSSLDVNISNSNGLFIKWGDLIQIGDFKIKFLPHYLSDYEYTYRASLKNYRLLVDPNLILKANTLTSGYRKFDKNLKIIDYLKLYFSKKTVKNPIYWSNFVFLTTPKKYWPRLIYKIWISSFKDIYPYLLKRPQ